MWNDGFRFRNSHEQASELPSSFFFPCRPPGGGIGNLTTAAIPVVERLLAAAVGGKGLGSLSLAKKRFHLKPLNTRRLVVLPKDLGRLPGLDDSCFQQTRMTRCDAAFFETGDPVNQFTRLYSDVNKLTAASGALTGCIACAFQQMQLGEARFKRQTALVLLEETKLQQATKSARNGPKFGHSLYLRRKLGELGDGVGQARALVGALGEKGTQRFAGPQGAIEIGVGAGLVCSNAHQIFRAGIDGQPP